MTATARHHADVLQVGKGRLQGEEPVGPDRPAMRHGLGRQLGASTERGIDFAFEAAHAVVGGDCIEIGARREGQHALPRGIIDSSPEQDLAVGEDLDQFAGRLALEVDDAGDRRKPGNEVVPHRRHDGLDVQRLYDTGIG